MKKFIAGLLAALMLITLLTACGSGPKLSGTYRADGLFTETTYTFSEDGSVTVRLTSGSKVLIEGAKGTYSFNADGSKITLTLPEATKDLGNLSFTIPELSGTFAFSKGEDYIQIGKTQYNKG